MRCELDLENGNVCLTPIRNNKCANENNHSLPHFEPWANICETLQLNPWTGKPDVEYWVYQSDMYWDWVNILDEL